MRVVLGVAGGIAAYKACSLLRLLTEGGHDVSVVPTASALQFVGAATWSALSGKPVHTDVWSDITQVPHVRIGQQADLVVVAPATADLLARAATGQADDLLTNVLLTARCPVVMAPAMHTEMWEHPATQANVATLTRARRARRAARLRSADRPDTGPGRLPEPEDLYAVCERELARAAGDAAHAAAHAASAHGRVPGDLAGRRVVVTAGGTREPLDPVRFLGNRSSGKQGYALARAAAERGAEVTLVVVVVAARPRRRHRGAGRDGPAAAGGGHRGRAPRRRRRHGGRRGRLPAGQLRRSKIKKTHVAGADGAADESAPTVELVRNPDVLAGLVAARGGARSPVIVGFAAETGDAEGSVLDHGRAKLARKGCDLLVVNEVGTDTTFGHDDSTVHLLRPGSDDATQVGPASKLVVAHAVWDAVLPLL